MSGAGEEDKTPAVGGAHINLKVKGQVCSPAAPPLPSLPRNRVVARFRSCGDRRAVVVGLACLDSGIDRVAMSG